MSLDIVSRQSADEVLEGSYSEWILFPTRSDPLPMRLADSARKETTVISSGRSLDHLDPTGSETKVLAFDPRF